MRRPLCLVLVALAAVASGAEAQVVPEDGADPAALDLTLGEAARLALTRSLALQRAGYTVDLQALDLREARAAADPEVSVSGGPTVRYARGYETNFFGLPDSLGSGPGVALGVGSEASLGVSVGAQLSLPLFDGGVRRARRQAAEVLLDAARLDRDRTVSDVVLAAAQDYVGVLRADALVAVERSNLDADRALLDRVRAEYDAGNRDLGDVLQQQAVIAAAEQRLATARRNEAVARLALRQDLRLPPGTPLALAPAAGALADLPPGPGADLGALVALALDRRDDLDAQEARIAAAGFDVRAARAGRRPQVSLGASVGTSYSSLDDNRGAFDQAFSVYPASSASLTVSVPILDAGRTRRAVERARVFEADAEATRDLVRLQVAAEVETAVLDVEAARARADAARAGVEAATEALAAAEARYRVGAGIFLDVLEARRSLVQAETDVAAARYDLLLGRVALAYQTGLLAEALVGLDGPAPTDP